MRAALSENGFAVNCRFNGFLFTLETVYHREQELLTESYHPQTGMLIVEVFSKSKTLFNPLFSTPEHSSFRKRRAQNSDSPKTCNDPLTNVFRRNVNLPPLPKMDRKSLLFIPN